MIVERTHARGGGFEALGDPEQEEHAAMLEWVGGDFDPETFDLKEVNRFLRQVR